MDKALRPDRFDADPSAHTAGKQWKHWFFTFRNYISSLNAPEKDRFLLLANHVGPDVFEHIADCDTYDSAIAILTSLYVKPKNVIYARHLLCTCKQEPGQNLDQFLQKLKLLAKDCCFKAVTADEYLSETVRDAFIRGILSNNVRQRLLEQDELNLDKAFTLARTLETAESQSISYSHSMPSSGTYAAQSSLDRPDNDSILEVAAVTTKCFFCGFNKHPRSKCPAREATCKLCNKIGHFQRVCKSTPGKHITSTAQSTISTLLTAALPLSISQAVIHVSVNGVRLNALIDTGSSDSYISSHIVHHYHWKIYPSHTTITMASTNLTGTTEGHCFVDLSYIDTHYNHIKLSLLPKLCSDVLLGHDFLKQHRHIQIPFGGPKPPLSICGLAAARIEPPSIFGSLMPNCRPITTRSRRLPPMDQKFVEAEIERLLTERIIEPAKSPWRAQVLVTTNENHKKRMVVDYSQTINQFTYLDAYPLPRIDDIVEKISHYGVYSTFDLKSAYHQIALREEDKQYTAFEACGNLYQFRRIPFGVTNGVACFQRIIDDLIKKEKLVATFAYVDNVTVCGRTMEEHTINYERFLTAADNLGLTFNESKTVIAARSITLLGYQVSQGTIKPDPERFRSLRELPPPSDLKSQQRVVGMFAYYSHWISHFSDKIFLLARNQSFPLPEPVKQSFNNLKVELENAMIATIDYQKPLVVETDASDIAIAATLNQEGRPVAFFSRSLTPSERNHSSIEKEAYAIVEALRKWRHYLTGVHFQLVTDQRSVSFMFDEKHKSKIKNEKILRWRIELLGLRYDVVYRPGRENQAADALSRAYCASATSADLKNLHDSLCHPGVSRMLHFVRSKNLPFSTQDVRTVTSNCPTCAELKPRFFKPPPGTLIKATQPFERLSIDFKGPLPSSSRNRYLLTMIDEFSRFPFAFACPDVSASTVISCFCQLFPIFGLPSFIHSDRGAAFMSMELKHFLQEKGVATSRTTPYNPAGNGQVERLNSTLWKSITLALKSRKLNIQDWEAVLPDALHAVRSLLCTATNATPHERLFNFDRRSTSGTSLPNWLINPGPVLMRRQQRSSKYDPLVEEVELLECNPQYAHIRLSNGREETVSVKQLAPRGNYSSDGVVVDSRPERSDGDSDCDTRKMVNIEDGESETDNGDQASTPPVPEFPVNHDSSDQLDLLRKYQQRLHPYNLRTRQA